MALRYPSNRAALLAVTLLALTACGDKRAGADTGAAVTPPRAHLLSPVLSVDWESGLPGGWTAETTSGTCTWHVVNNPQNLKVASDLNPASVTLPDSGAHLPAKGGTHVVWFGEDTTGTFVGTPYNAGGKNGGESTAIQTGTLTSPAFSLAGAAKADIEFDSWWEIEGVAGQDYDIMLVEVSTDGTTWNEAGRLNPTFSTGATSDVGYTAGGSGAAPQWRHYAFDLSSYAGQANVQVRFSFNTGDMAYNGFRGWTIDNVSVGSGSSLPAPTLSGVDPAVGTTDDQVAIAGANFVQGATFYLGATQIPAGNIVQFGTEYMLFKVPSGLTNGTTYDVKVVNPDGQQAVLTGGFKFSSTASPKLTGVSPATGSVGVAKSVTLTGTGFVSGATVDVGAYAATSVVVANATSITATFPAMPSGNYNVTVTNPSGQAGTKFAAYSIPVVVDTSTVTVTSPNGGESWTAGTTHAITWIETGVTTARIDLYKGGSFSQTIATGVSAAGGTYSWAIPSDLAPGADYTVKVSNQLGVNGDYGDASFTVAAPASGTSLSASGGTTSYTAPGAAVAVDPGLTVTGASTLDSATVAISSGFVAGEDVLSFTDQNGIAGSYNATTGILTLTGSASAATYQAALASVTYANSAGNTATTGPRQITFSLGSGLYYAGTGHYYEFVAVPGIAWTDAVTAASVRSYFGLQGYLVTVTSAGENDFIQGKLSGQGWMGASTPIFTVPRTWSWVTGPETGTPFFTQTTEDPAPGGGTAIGGAFSNWASGEPNNWSGNENYAHFYIDGTWNDFPDIGGDIAGYVVEYGGMAGDPVVTLSGTKSLQVNGPYALTFQTDGTSGASITGTNPQYVQPGGNASAVTANAPLGYHFVNWTGTNGFVTTTSNSLTVTGVAASMTLTAHFQASVCGNGVKESGEQCDDGNTNPADGCSATCTVEPGYACPTAGAACTPVHGDGILTAGEQCDDGNTSNSDGCSSTGQIEPGYACYFTAPNLIQNGSFDQGSTGWTSAYTWSSPTTSNAIYDEGTWSVGSDGNQLHDAIPAGFRDAEGSASNMAAYFNGASTPLDALNQTVSLTAGKTYVLSMYVTNWGGATDSPYPKLSISIGGQLLTTNLTLTSSSWVRVGGTFTAAATGPATLKVTDSVTAASGNDFAVDAVALREAAPETCGMVCARDGDCAAAGAGFWCDTTAVGHPALCTAPLPPGTPIPTIPNRDPSDPPLDGTCTPANAGSVCASGACNAAAGTCASASGECVDGSQCVSNVCGASLSCVPLYTVRFQTDGTAGASLSGAATQDVVSGDSTSAVTAVAPAAHNFSGWTGSSGFTSAANPLVVSDVTGDLALTAHFAGVGSLAAASGADQSATVGTAFAAPLCVVVRDTDGVLLPGAPVHLTVPGTGASAALTADLTSDGDGLACTSLTANHVAGAFSVSASSGAVSAVALAAFTSTADAPASWSYAHGALAEQSTTVGKTFAQPLSIRVRDQYGNPVPNVQVTFAHHDDGGTGYQTNLSAASASTGLDGIAEVTGSAGDVTGWESFDVSFGGLDPVTAFTLQATPDLPATLTVDPLSTPQAAQVGGNSFAAALGVTVTDRWGNAVPGVAVAFEPPAGGATAALSTTTATTDATGHAEVLASAGTAAGAYAVTATAAGLQTTFALTNTVGAPGAILVLGGDEQRASVDGAFAAPLTVEVVDAYANPVPGVLVSFQLSASDASATLSSSAFVTDSDGQASITATPDTVAGAFQVIASAPGVTAPAVFSLTLDPGVPATVTTRSTSDGQTAQVATAFLNALEVVVRDSHGNPVPGVQVTFSAPGSGAGTDLSAGTATTGADGVAGVLATANTVSGGYQVTATVEDLPAPATFALANQPDAPDVLSTTGGTPQETTVDATLSPLTVSIRDRYGNPVPGVEVVFTAPDSGASAALDATRATTDASGAAQVTGRAGTVSGAYEVVATAAGVAAPVHFAFVNLPGAAASLAVSSGSQDQSTRVGDPFAAPLTVTVVDAHGNPVPGVTVGFACPATGATCTLDAGAAVSDASGRATVHATAGSLPGSVEVVATAEGTSPTIFRLHDLVGLPGSIATTGGASQEASVYTAYPDTLGVVVRDAFGNLVPGVEVAFEVVSAGPQSVTLGAASATTDDAGLASVTAVANGAKGLLVVRASAPGVATPAEFTLTNVAIATTLTLDVQLPVFGTVVSETGVSHLRATVGPDAGGVAPTGTVTFRASRTLELVPGQPGVVQDGDAIIAPVVNGAADVQVRVIGWRSRTLEATYTPDDAAAPTWKPATKTVELVADVPNQSHGGGGCSTGADGATVLGTLPLLLLALRLRRRRR